MRCESRRAGCRQGQWARSSWMGAPVRPELTEMEAVADMLVAAGRRREAIALVEEASDCTALLLLARLHLEGETREGAKAAVDAITLWRMHSPADLEALAL